MGQLKPGRGDISRAVTPIIDRTAALELSASLAYENRLDFARSFSAAIASDYRRILANSPDMPDLLAPPLLDRAILSKDARGVAAQIAVGLETLPPAEVSYAIGTLYTALLPAPFRAQHGIFYTPPELVECLLIMAEEADVDWRTARVLDPACGGGAFLIGVASRMARALEDAEPAIALQSIAARLRGFDLDPFGAWLAQAMLAIALEPLTRAAGRSPPRLAETRDSLDLDADEVESYDLVIGNPPYGRVTLSPERRRQFARSVYGHANLYGLFTHAALHWLKPGGVVGYVTPTSMLSGLYYKALRALLAAEAPPLSVNFVSERDGVFADVLQETMLATYRKGGVPVAGNVGFIDVARDSKIISRKAGRFTLPATPASPWLLPRTAEQAGLTRRLRSMRHRLADYGYGVSTGPLVWNRHKGQFRKKPEAAAIPVIWAEAVTSDGRFLWRSEKRNHAPWFAATRPKDDWLIVMQPCVLVQRTTAKEQPRRLIAAELPAKFIREHKRVTVENHVNMVRGIRPNPSVPPATIAALLNSATVDAAFRCLNGSVAVSAFELEELPLPAPTVMRKLADLVATGAPSAKIAAAIGAAYGRHDAAASP
jgi:adenine-specific DNA-methyltransferase